MRGGCIGVRIALKSSSIDNTLVILSTLSTLINLCSGWWWYERTRSTLVVIASTYYWLVLVAGGSCGRNFGNRESRGREPRGHEARPEKKVRASPTDSKKPLRRWSGPGAGRPGRLEGWKSIASPIPTIIASRPASRTQHGDPGPPQRPQPNPGARHRPSHRPSHHRAQAAVVQHHRLPGGDAGGGRLVLAAPRGLQLRRGAGGGSRDRSPLGQGRLCLLQVRPPPVRGAAGPRRGRRPPPGLRREEVPAQGGHQPREGGEEGEAPGRGQEAEGGRGPEGGCRAIPRLRQAQRPHGACGGGGRPKGLSRGPVRPAQGHLRLLPLRGRCAAGQALLRRPRRRGDQRGQ